jgi:hypothetical protein
MKIREIVMKYARTGITQERKDAAVKKVNVLLNKMGLGYTIKKIEKSLLEKIMEKFMIKSSGGSLDKQLSFFGDKMSKGKMESEKDKRDRLAKEQKNQKLKMDAFMRELTSGGSASDQMTFKERLSRNVVSPVVMKGLTALCKSIRYLEEDNKKLRSGGAKKKRATRAYRMK